MRSEKDSNANQIVKEPSRLKRLWKTPELVNAVSENDSNFNKIRNEFLSNRRLMCTNWQLFEAQFKLFDRAGCKKEWCKNELEPGQEN